MPDSYRPNTSSCSMVMYTHPPLNHQKPIQHCHCYLCSWHACNADQMVTLSSLRLPPCIRDTMNHPILIRVLSPCYCALDIIHECYWINQMNSYFHHQRPLETNQFLDGLNQTLPYTQLGQSRNTRHNTPTAYEISFRCCTTRQHSLFRNALISLIIDLRLSGSRTAWLYDSSATSSLSLTVENSLGFSSTGSVFSLNTSSTAAISFRLTRQTYFLINVR